MWMTQHRITQSGNMPFHMTRPMRLSQYTVEVHIRTSPKDEATAHLAHRGDVVWFDLNVVTPKGLSEDELYEIARPFEEVMVASGGVAHPHKLVVDIDKAGIPRESINFLTTFQNKHDPNKKMANPALCHMLKQTVPKPMSNVPARKGHL